MSIWIIAVHVVLAITAYFGCAMFFATDRGTISRMFLPAIWVFFGFPAMLCGWYLHGRNLDLSAIVVFSVAGGFGVLKARWVEKRSGLDKGLAFPELESKGDYTCSADDHSPAFSQRPQPTDAGRCNDKALGTVEPNIFGDSLIASSDNRSFAYIAQAPSGVVVVAKGSVEHRSRLYDGVAQGSPLFSPNCRRFAYGVRDGNTWKVVVDGKEGKAYRGIGANGIVFSSDGQRVAYSAESGGSWKINVDGVEQAAYEGISSNPVFSIDGRRLAYVGNRNGRDIVVLDGKELGTYEATLKGTPVFSPDGSRMAWVARRDSRTVVFVDQRQTGIYDVVGEGTLAFSPDGRRFAHGGGGAGGRFLVVDGKEGRRCDGIGNGSPRFSPDSSRIAYSGLRNGKWFISIDGSEVGPYDATAAGPIFSPDSQRVAYAGRRGSNHLGAATLERRHGWQNRT
jgi:hypothetical protein